MLVELYIFSFVIVAYGTFTTLALIGIGKLRRQVPASRLPDPYISIVMSMRNEEEHIILCLGQLVRQSYPVSQFELILIDDASEDSSFAKAQAFLERSGMAYTLTRQSTHKGKKHNIAQAIAQARGSIIVTSDADVVFRYSTWLAAIANYFKLYKPGMLVMPVDFKPDGKLLTAFQIVENMALTAITAGYTGLQKPFMCNGANLAFLKSAYDAVGGYESHRHIASGDDVFLLEDLKKADRRAIHYLFSRELIAHTSPQPDMGSLFLQRLRWASKTKHNSSALNLLAGLIVMLANLLFLALVVAILKKSWIIPYLSIFVAAKFVFDFLLLFLASDFLGRIRYLAWFLPFECVYWIYAFVIGISSFFIKPSWKGKKTT